MLRGYEKPPLFHAWITGLEQVFLTLYFCAQINTLGSLTLIKKKTQISYQKDDKTKINLIKEIKQKAKKIEPM